MKPFNAAPSKLLLMLFPLLLTSLLCSCQKKEPETPVAPFSEATWEYTLENIQTCEGDDYTTYDSLYGGLCYNYPKVYQNHPGTIKYMFDDEERLMCIAWTCSSEEEQELYDLYGLIEKSVTEQTSTESLTTDRTVNTGHVWYREDGNIILSLMITSNLKAFQYSYLHPDVSSEMKE